MIELIGSAAMFVVVLVFAVVVQHRTVKKLDPKVKAVEKAAASATRKLSSGSHPTTSGVRKA